MAPNSDSVPRFCFLINYKQNEQSQVLGVICSAYFPERFIYLLPLMIKRKERGCGQQRLPIVEVGRLKGGFEPRT